MIQRFKQKIDAQGMLELFRAMEVVKTKKDEFVMKYGSSNNYCYFVITGEIIARAPIIHPKQFPSFKELIDYCSRHYKDIIWERTANGAILRETTQEYIKDMHKQQ